MLITCDAKLYIFQLVTGRQHTSVCENLLIATSDAAGSV
jgi:hypothetical protein